MITWDATCYEDGRVTNYTWLDTDWWNLPDRIIYVDLWLDGANHRRRLQGMDNYYLDGRYYGMFNDPENEDIYEGLQEVGWHLTAEGQEQGHKHTPGPSQVKKGVMIPQDLAERLGVA